MVSPNDIGGRQESFGPYVNSLGMALHGKPVGTVTIGVVMLFCAGCTLFKPPVERRIEKNQAVFDTFPLEVKETLRRGQVEVGYDEEMVRIALGHPHRTYLRRHLEDEILIWVYFDERVRSRRHWIDVELPMFNPQGHRILRREKLDLDLDDYQEFTKTRIEFADGKVTAVEQLVD